MRYYLRATGDNRYEVGTEQWMEIVDLKKVREEYYEITVDTPASINRYVCIDRDQPCDNLEFAKEHLGYTPITHLQFLDETVGADV